MIKIFILLHKLMPDKGLLKLQKLILLHFDQLSKYFLTIVFISIEININIGI